jgi:crotonobetainyl-CoA:carnitine CoA-transferase CaiB-like acyl-CoA transferase
VTLNRNKKSVAFDMFSDEGRTLLDELICKADILIQNYALRTAQDLGFTEERLMQLNPRLIVLSITAYGAEGPDAERVGFDGLAQARSGAMGCNGEEKPFLNHLPYVDFSTALYGSFGLMAALYERERTGKGQVIHASLIDTVSSFIGSYGMIAEAILGGTPRHAQGNALVFALGDCVQAKDGDFVVFNIIGNMFNRLCDMLGHPEWRDDARFATDESRYAHRDAIVPHVAAWAKRLTVPEILETTETFRLPFERVSTVDDLARDAHARARNLFPQVPQPGLGDIPVARQGLSLSGHEPAPLQPAPAIGEHTASVLQDWLDYTPSQLQALRDKGTLG